MTDAGNKNGCSGVKNLEKIQVTNYFNPNSDKKEEGNLFNLIISILYFLFLK